MNFDKSNLQPAVHISLAALAVMLTVILTSINFHPASAHGNHKNSLLVAVDEFGDVYGFPSAIEANEGQFIGTGDAAGVADFDNDGYCEVITASKSDRLLRIYETVRNRDSTEIIASLDAYPAQDFAVTWDGATGDFDNNGWVDFAISGARCGTGACPAGGEGLIQIHLNQGNFNFTRISIDVTQFGADDQESMRGIDDGYFNADQHLDLAVQKYINRPTNDTYLFTNGGNLTFSETIPISHTNGGTPRGGVPGLIAGDFNGDGHFDLIIGQDNDGDPGQTWLYAGDGTGSFSLFGEAYDTNPIHEEDKREPGGGYPDAFDIDDDGHLDIFAPAAGLSLMAFRGNGDGTFQPPVTIKIYAHFIQTAAPSSNETACRWEMPYKLFLPFKLAKPIGLGLLKRQ